MSATLKHICLMNGAAGSEIFDVFASPFPFPNGHKQDVSAAAEALTSAVEVTIDADLLRTAITFELQSKEFEDCQSLNNLIDGDQRLVSVRLAVRDVRTTDNTAAQKSLDIILKLRHLLQHPEQSAVSAEELQAMTENEWAAFGACDFVAEERAAVLKVREMLINVQDAELATARAAEALAAATAAPAAAPADAPAATCLAAIQQQGGEASGAGAGDGDADAVQTAAQRTLLVARMHEANAKLELEYNAALITHAATAVHQGRRAATSATTSVMRTPLGVLEFDAAATPAATEARTRISAAMELVRKARRDLLKHVDAVAQQAEARHRVHALLATNSEELHAACAELRETLHELGVVSRKMADVTEDLVLYRRTNTLVIHAAHVAAVDDCLATSVAELEELGAKQKALLSKSEAKRARVTELRAQQSELMERLGVQGPSSPKRKLDVAEELATVEALEGPRAKANYGGAAATAEACVTAEA